MYLKIETQVNWDEKYLTHVGHFSHVNLGFSCHSGETSHLGEMSHLIQTTPQICSFV